MRTKSHILVPVLFLLALPIGAQRRVSADVEVKQVAAGKVTTITKSVYCTNNGRLVINFHTPQEYFAITNVVGETRLYMPQGNQVLSDNSGMLSSKDELLYIFMSGRADDLGLGQFGYSLVSTTREEGNLIKKTYSSKTEGNQPRAEIVLENYLPIYCAYLDNTGKVSSKTFFSKYQKAGRMMLPCRVTNITYTSPKDSSVSRTIYTNLKVDEDNPLFDFEVPSDAKPVSVPSTRMGK